MLLMPWIKNPWARIPTGDASGDQAQILFDKVRLVFAVATVISQIVAFAFEKWRHGAVRNLFRVFWNGCIILAVNCLISFYGVLWIVAARTHR